MRLPGDPEKAGTFLAHSFVLFANEVLKAFEASASRRGEVLVEVRGAADVGLSSGSRDCEEAGTGGGFVVSLIAHGQLTSYLTATSKRPR